MIKVEEKNQLIIAFAVIFFTGIVFCSNIHAADKATDPEDYVIKMMRDVKEQQKKEEQEDLEKKQKQEQEAREYKEQQEKYKVQYEAEMAARQKLLERQAEMYDKADEKQKRDDVLYAKAEENQKRYDTILTTWENQQKQYQKYLDGLEKKS